jgi:hypothetical protein
VYSVAAKALRRCKGKRKDGLPCRAWAVWADPSQLCTSHAGRHHTGPMNRRFTPTQRARYEPCACEAYHWPHRPGGGLCCWPDVPPWASSNGITFDQLEPSANAPCTRTIFRTAMISLLLECFSWIGNSEQRDVTSGRFASRAPSSPGQPAHTERAHGTHVKPPRLIGSREPRGREWCGARGDG